MSSDEDNNRKKGKLTKEQLEELANKTGQVHIHMPKGASASNDDVEKQFGKSMLSKLKKQCEELGVDYEDSSVEDIETTIMAVGVAKKGRLAEEEKEARRNAHPEKHGGSGSIPLSSAEGNNNEGFESYEEMIDFIREKEKRGTPKQKKQANTVLNKMFQNFLKSEVSVKIDHNKEEKSIIQDLRKRWLKDKLRKMGIKEGDIVDAED